MRKRFQARAAVIMIVLSLASISFHGCVKLSKPYPIKQYFVLEAKRPGASVPCSGASIRIKDPEISPLFSAKSFVYKTGDLEFATDFYNEFFIVPDRMVKTQIQDWLGKSGLFRRISPDPGEKTDYVLESNIVNLYVDKTTAKAVMEISFFLMSGAKGDGEIVWHGNYREEEPVRDASSAAMAAAFCRSLGNSLGHLETNLKDKVKR